MYFRNSGPFFIISLIIFVILSLAALLSNGFADYRYEGTIAVPASTIRFLQENEVSYDIKGAKDDLIEISCKFTAYKEQPLFKSILVEKWERNFWNSWNPQYTSGAWLCIFITLLFLCLFVTAVAIEIHDLRVRHNIRQKDNVRFKSVSPESKYSPVILSALGVPPEDVYGVVAYREWSYYGGFLHSVGVDYEWTKSIEKCDLSRGTYGGLHAYKINSIGINTTKLVTGLVELRGKVIEHSDGVLRAEWARILVLFCHNNNTCNLLSGIYGVPTMNVKEKELLLNQDWINKIKEGRQWVLTQI